MNEQKSQTFSTKQEMLNALAEEALPQKNFTQVNYRAGKESFTSYAGTEPFKCPVKLSYGGTDYANDEGVIINLNLPEQVYLNSRLSKRFGMAMRHGTLREQKEAVWSNETKDYRNNVLYYWLFTGQVLRGLGRTYEAREAVGAEFVRQTKPADADMLVEIDGKLIQEEVESGRVVPKLKLGPVLQTNISLGTGHYSDFSSEVPTKSELGPRNEESKGRFGSVYLDKQLLAAVWSFWLSVDRVLGVGAVGPLVRGFAGPYYDGALVVWTKENPKK